MGRPWKAWFNIEQSETDRTVVLYTQVFRKGRTVSSRTQMCILKKIRRKLTVFGMVFINDIIKLIEKINNTFFKENAVITVDVNF